MFLDVIFVYPYQKCISRYERDILYVFSFPATSNIPSKTNATIVGCVPTIATVYVITVYEHTQKCYLLNYQENTFIF